MEGERKKGSVWDGCKHHIWIRVTIQQLLRTFAPQHCYSATNKTLDHFCVNALVQKTCRDVKTSVKTTDKGKNDRRHTNTHRVQERQTGEARQKKTLKFFWFT